MFCLEGLGRVSVVHASWGILSSSLRCLGETDQAKQLSSAQPINMGGPQLALQGTPRMPSALVHCTTGSSKVWGSKARANICASSLSAQVGGQGMARAKFAFYCPGRHPTQLRCAEEERMTAVVIALFSTR